ncbi:hypothetical protein [Rhizobium sp. LCM 4573]|uniref:hypothetical protein n=1 Tax=Rhizobium sp. LCM 4573 TaxID=1848291 RepID=UPI0008DA760C|nr:hypothetical protein [Rhizobium sp. LCM 4573]OHV78549.1 hypothetical protein LCM4573_26620 [Rhizobium sp. LCM 4573]
MKQILYYALRVLRCVFRFFYFAWVVCVVYPAVALFFLIGFEIHAAGGGAAAYESVVRYLAEATADTAKTGMVRLKTCSSGERNQVIPSACDTQVVELVTVEDLASRDARMIANFYLFWVVFSSVLHAGILLLFRSSSSRSPSIARSKLPSRYHGAPWRWRWESLQGADGKKVFIPDPTTSGSTPIRLGDLKGDPELLALWKNKAPGEGKDAGK